eukprot:SM000387S14692  [mRNA]  locus=s387:25898:27481:- [translate_table: standard]
MLSLSAAALDACCLNAGAALAGRPRWAAPLPLERAPSRDWSAAAAGAAPSAAAGAAASRSEGGLFLSSDSEADDLLDDDGEQQSCRCPTSDAGPRPWLLSLLWQRRIARCADEMRSGKKRSAGKQLSKAGGSGSALGAAAAASPAAAPPAAALSHLMTERRRRERLNAQFLALRGIVPNITKMNKSSTLEDAIDYIHSLQGKVAAMERRLATAEEAARDIKPLAVKEAVEDAEAAGVAGSAGKTGKLVPPAAPPPPTPNSSHEEAVGPAGVHVDVRLIDSEQVLLRVQCARRRGLLSDVLAALDSTPLDVRHASCMSSANCVSVHIFSSAVEGSGSGTWHEELEQKIAAAVVSQLRCARRTGASNGGNGADRDDGSNETPPTKRGRSSSRGA